MDGTFTVAPPQFAQLYTVHGLSNEHYVIGCYALLPNKQRDTYVEFLRQVQRLTNGASPETIMIDYEQACMSHPACIPKCNRFWMLLSSLQVRFQARTRGRITAAVYY